MAKRKAPQKDCPSCSGKCHARASTCKSCGHVFFKKKLSIVEDWTQLQSGDEIKSVKGHGSYWINTETKEKTYMGVYGKLIVKSVRHDGVLAYTIHKGLKSSIVEFVYMGEPEQCFRLMDNYHRRPHKLIWAKSKKRLKKV